MRCGSSIFGKLALAALLLLCRPASAADARAWDAAGSLASVPPPPGLRLVQSPVGGDPAEALNRLERAGFDVAVALPPHVFYVRRERRRDAFLPAGFVFGRESAARELAVDAPARVAAPEEDPFGGREDAFPPAGPASSTPRSRVARTGIIPGLPHGARWTDTSEYMIGRIAVSIILPESDGSTDPNRYDWTPSLRDSVVRSAVRGFAKWTEFAARRGIDVTFALEVHAGLPTRFEPIDRSVGEEDLWIQDVLIPLAGYRADALTLSYEVANAARGRLGAQWGFLVFGVQNDTDPDGAFSDGIIAHARLGGPHFVIPVNNLNTTSATLDYYMEHEVAHTFWSLDEHFPSSGWWACSLRTGYLDYPNYNSVVPAPGYCGYRRGCLMYANQPESLCVYTEGQIGWADKNGTGVPDLIETRAAVFPDSEQYRAVAGQPLILRGYAADIALPNQNPYHFFAGDTIGIAVIDSVLFTLDGGSPMKAAPLDGAFDMGREYFVATLPALPPGSYIVEWEAWNSNGLPSLVRPVTLLSLRASTAPAGAADGPPSPPAFALRFGPSPTSGSVRFTLEGKPGASGWARVCDVAGRVMAEWPVRVPPAGSAAWRWDGRVRGGGEAPSGIYFLTIRMDGDTLTRRLVISR